MQDLLFCQGKEWLAVIHVFKYSSSEFLGTHPDADRTAMYSEIFNLVDIGVAA